MITKAFMEGANAHKKSTESIVASSTGKFSESQLARLQGWCGLAAGHRHLLPPIWDKMQAAKDKDDAKAVVVKEFERMNTKLEEPLNIYFSDRLIDDLRKLRLSPSKDPDYASSHLGVSILAVMPISARKQVLLDEDSKEKESATLLTVADVKASKSGPPQTPTSYDAGMRVLRQYKFFLSTFFGTECGHLKEVVLIYLSSRSLQNRLCETMGQKDWANLCWAIIVDARNFFGTYTDVDDLKIGALPVSNLATTRSLIQAHTEVRILDTPSQWLPKLSTPKLPGIGGGGGTPWSRAEELGATPGRGKRKVPSDNGANGKNVIDLTTRDVVNNDMHPFIAALMKPAQDRSIPLSVAKICKACGLNGIGFIKKVPRRNACYQWMLGQCKATCPSGHEHLAAVDIPDNYATALCEQLSSGIKKLVDNKEVPEPDSKKPKVEA